MGRGRGRGKKQSTIGSLDDNGSGEDEKLPIRRRGRPTKPLIEEEDEIVKIEDDDGGGGGGGGGDVDVEEMKISKTAENGRKRKRGSQVKENAGSLKDENGLGTKTNGADLIKPVGYRQKGSRRKNKPRRAAEVGVECR